MNPFSTPSPTDRLTIYLNDHRAMVMAELAAADRCRTSNEGSELAHDLTRHIGEVNTDRDLLDEMITDLDGTIDQLKTFGALAGERLGRLKTNGQLVGYSPLSRVVELETLIGATQARLAMWKAIECVPHSTPSGRPSERRDIAAAQLEMLDEQHRLATAAAFAAESTR